MKPFRVINAALEKYIIITYSESVFVALGIQNAKRMRHIFICGLSGCNIFLNIISNTARLSGNEKITEKNGCYFLCISCLQHFSFYEELSEI